MAASIGAPSRTGARSRKALLAMLAITGTFFLMSLRLSHFKEWWWDAEVNRVYPVLAYYNHTYGVREAGMSWKYVAALNYYRVVSGQETLAEFVSEGDVYREDKPVYVLHRAFDRGFVEKQGLKVVFHGELSDVVVAIRPEVEHRRPDGVR